MIHTSANTERSPGSGLEYRRIPARTWLLRQASSQYKETFYLGILGKERMGHMPLEQWLFIGPNKAKSVWLSFWNSLHLPHECPFKVWSFYKAGSQRKCLTHWNNNDAIQIEDNSYSNCIMIEKEENFQKNVEFDVIIMVWDMKKKTFLTWPSINQGKGRGLAGIICPSVFPLPLPHPSQLHNNYNQNLFCLACLSPTCLSRTKAFPPKTRRFSLWYDTRQTIVVAFITVMGQRYNILFLPHVASCFTHIKRGKRPIAGMLSLSAQPF